MNNNLTKRTSVYFICALLLGCKGDLNNENNLYDENNILESYTYYKNGNLEKVIPMLNDSIIDGNYYLLYEDGTKHIVSHYQNNQLDGLKKQYYQSGELEYIENFVKGKRDGKATWYYTSGSIKYELYFIKDKEIGLQREYFEDGKTKFDLFIDESKNIRFKREFNELGELIIEEGPKFYFNYNKNNVELDGVFEIIFDFLIPLDEKFKFEIINKEIGGNIEMEIPCKIKNFGFKRGSLVEFPCNKVGEFILEMRMISISDSSILDSSNLEYTVGNVSELLMR